MALNTKDIKRKIASIQKTQQITKAMKMVAAAKLRKIQNAALQFRPYMNKIENVTSSLVESASPIEHPLLYFRDVKNVNVVIITSDKGLCGGFNHNIIKEAEKFIANKLSGKSVHLTLIGKYAYNYFKFKGVAPKHVYMNILQDIARYSDADSIVKSISKEFIKEESDEVYIIYNYFVNVLVQKTQIRRILPISFNGNEKNKESIVEKYVFEPSKEDVLKSLLPKYLNNVMYDSMLESLAGEYAARMTAMDAATSNAGNMIESLMVEFNKARQASITKELTEIVTSIEAMK